MQLRSYQQDIINQINASQSKRIIVSAPTGAGKAITLLSLAKQYTDNNKQVLLLVDRLQLVNQLSDTASNLHITHNVITGDKNITHQDNYLTIASIQSWSGKGCYDLLLIDECHTLYKPITSYLTQFKGLCVGFTATPYTTGLKAVYDTIINTVTQAELTASNMLCDIVAYEMTPIDMTGATLVAGEYKASDVRDRSHDIYGDVIEFLTQHAELQTDTLIFCASIAHCEDVKQQLNNNNINCSIYTSKQNKTEREQILNDFILRKCGILITVATLSKGFDCPQIKHILDLRPLKKSLAEYIQMIGRGTRTYKDKTHCKLIDFSGNYERFCVEINDIYNNGVINKWDSLQFKPEKTKSTKIVDDPKTPVNNYLSVKKDNIICEKSKLQIENIQDIGRSGGGEHKTFWQFIKSIFTSKSKKGRENMHKRFENARQKEEEKYQKAMAKFDKEIEYYNKLIAIQEANSKRKQSIIF